MKRFLCNATILFAIIVLPAPIWLVVTHQEYYPVDPDRNILFLGDSRVKYGLDDNTLTRAVNHSFSSEQTYCAYINLRSILAGPNNIDTVVVSFWSRVLSSNIESLSEATRGFDKRMQYVTLEDIKETKMSPITLIKPIVTTLLYSSDNPIGCFDPDDENNIELSILHSERNIKDGKIDHPYINKYGLQYRGLLKIQDLCRERGIALILMTVPSYNEDRYQGHVSFRAQLRDSLRGSGFTYVDFADFPLADSCYKDVLHLNRHGAKQFSEHLRRHGLLYGADEVIEFD